MSMLFRRFRPPSVTSILASYLGINLVRAGVGTTWNPVGMRALKSYGHRVVDSIHLKNAKKRNL